MRNKTTNRQYAVFRILFLRYTLIIHVTIRCLWVVLVKRPSSAIHATLDQNSANREQYKSNIQTKTSSKKTLFGSPNNRTDIDENAPIEYFPARQLKGQWIFKCGDSMNIQGTTPTILCYRLEIKWKLKTLGVYLLKFIRKELPKWLHHKMLSYFIGLPQEDPLWCEA